MKPGAGLGELGASGSVGGSACLAHWLVGEVRDGSDLVEDGRSRGGDGDECPSHQALHEAHALKLIANLVLDFDDLLYGQQEPVDQPAVGPGGAVGQVLPLRDGHGVLEPAPELRELAADPLDPGGVLR